MNRRLALLGGGVLMSAAIAAAADVPAIPHPVGPPVIYGLTPNSGPTAGATQVEIFGNDLSGATSVKFGTTPASRFVVFPRRIFVRSPASSGGSFHITVTTPLGTSATTPADLFTYGPSGTVVDAVDPRQGTAAGGTTVVVLGHGLWGASSIQFGSVSIPCFLPTASALTTPTLPSLASGGGNFDPLLSPGGGGKLDTATLSQERALLASGLQQPLAGGGPGSRCLPFGDDSHLFVLSPPGTANTTVDISVTNGGVPSATSSATKFTYVAPVAPVVNAVGPSHGTANGGTNVRIFGSGFSGATGVNFGTTAVSPCAGPLVAAATLPSTREGGNLRVPTGGMGGKATRFGRTLGGGGGPGICFTPPSSDTELFLQSPPGAVGTFDVTVTTPAGTSAAGATTKYTNDPPGPPQVDAVTPPHGSALGGGNVHIQGSSLTGATAVKIGTTSIPPCGPSTPGGCFFPGGDTDLFVNPAPPGPANSTVDVTVDVGASTSATSAATKFTFDTATVPVIQAMDPNHGLANGGTNVNLFGKGFGSATSLTFGAVTMSPCGAPGPGPCFGVGNDNNITFTTPGNHNGPLVNPVKVTNAAGASAPMNFTYDLPVALSVTGASPNTGPTSGNTSIWLTGTGFNETSGVTFETSTGAIYVAGYYVPFGSDTVLQVFTPQVDPGTTLVDIIVHRPSDMSPITASDHFTYAPVNAVVPTVTSVTPSTASTSATVVLYGSGFSMASQVTFGSAPAAGLYVPNDHVIVTSSPPNGTGTVQVHVTTPAGTNSTGAMFTFGATPAGPQVGGLDPFQGTQLGGTNMNIYGVGFNFAASVSFGSTTLSPCGSGPPGPCFVLNGDNYLYVNTPPQGTNPTQVEVRVTASGMTSPIVAADKYTFVAPVAPAVNAVDPQVASTFGGSGGAGLTVYGSGFSGATAVNVGPNMLPPCGPPGGGFFGGCFFIGGDNQINAPIPPGSPGPVEVTVTTPTGTSALNPPADQLTYQTPGPPTVSSITPNSGPTSDGTVTYIIGTNLQGASITFGQNPAFNILQFNSSATLLAVVSPPASAGPVLVHVTTPSGTATGLFTYNQSPAPTIKAASPNHGPGEGGTQVLITGTDLGGTNAVRFGSANTSAFFDNFDFFTESPGPLMASSPPGAGGTTVDISVTTPAGTSAPVAADHFTYAVPGPPLVTGIAPITGVTEGGEEIFVVGTDLGNATKVTFGSGASAGFFPIAPGVLLVGTPPATAGTVDITVTTPVGTSGTSANTKFTFVTTPRAVITTISPTHGPPGTPVLISGTNLGLNKMNDVVNFGTAAAFVFQQVSTGVIEAFSPPPPPGSATVDITVSNDGGTSATGAADLYTFAAAQAPTVTVIAPDRGPAGTPVVITGTNLGGTTEVDFGSDLATSIFVRSDTLVIAFSPCDNGVVSVIVKTAAGTSTSPNTFKFKRCRGPQPPGGTNPPRTSISPPPLPPGPPPGPRGLPPQNVPGSAGTLTTTSVEAALPTVTRSIDAIWLQLRAMSALVGGP